MKVDKINAYKEVFKNHLTITQNYNELYKYECLQNFQTHWDLGALDLKTVYDKSYSSNISGRLWGGSTNSPKSIMLKFMDMDKEFVRSMFRDLYNEDKDLGMRINRFKFHCDQLLEKLQETEQQWNDHFHTDEEVALYLAFQYPKTYNLYNYGPFSIMMQRLELKNIPEDYQSERYFKLCKGLYTMLSKDEELLELHRAKRADEVYYGDNTMLMVHDYLLICSQSPVLA